jgi:hypothetical protein
MMSKVVVSNSFGIFPLISHSFLLAESGLQFYTHHNLHQLIQNSELTHQHILLIYVGLFGILIEDVVQIELVLFGSV